MNPPHWASYSASAKNAHKLVGNALASGRLVPRPCEVCGTTKRIHAHHDDYEKPFDIRWLCASHHRKDHLTEVDWWLQATRQRGRQPKRRFGPPLPPGISNGQGRWLATAMKDGKPVFLGSFKRFAEAVAALSMT